MLTCQRRPLHESIGALGHDDTALVFFDMSGRVFLDTERTPRVFGNV